MALIKELETQIGVAASYWNVGDFLLDKSRKKVMFKMFGYYDKVTYDNGKKHIDVISMSFDLDMNDPFISPFKDLSILYEVANGEKNISIRLNNTINLSEELNIDLPLLINQVLSFCYVIAKQDDRFIDSIDDI